jgi:proteasome activator subunit 4
VRRISAFVNRYQLIQEQDDIHKLVLSKLQDSQVEVRELAAGSLTSLLFGRDDTYVLEVAEHCKKLASQSLRLRQKADETDAAFSARQARAITRKHAGVLGLAAIVTLHPYDVPKWLPDILSTLASHGNAVNPISVCGATNLQCTTAVWLY